MSRRWLTRLSLPAALAGLLCLLASVPAQDRPPSEYVKRNARLGMPSPARADPSQREDYLLERPQYVLSYNATKRTPNWVSWRLVKSDIGNAARAAFEPDPLLPRGFARVTSHVYDGSGFDRGHMCPAKDRSATAKDSQATFYTTIRPRPARKRIARGPAAACSPPGSSCPRTRKGMR